MNRWIVRPVEWAEKLQPQRDAKSKVNSILGVVDPAAEQEVLGRLLALNLAAAPPVPARLSGVPGRMYNYRVRRVRAP